MSASKLLFKQLAKAKRDIKNRYLAGESVPSIARDYGISDRAIYYHLGKITPDEKGLHTKNQDLRRMATKQNRKEDQNVGQTESGEGTTEAPKSSISDFVE